MTKQCLRNCYNWISVHVREASVQGQLLQVAAAAGPCAIELDNGYQTSKLGIGRPVRWYQCTLPAVRIFEAAVVSR